MSRKRKKKNRSRVQSKAKPSGNTEAKPSKSTNPKRKETKGQELSQCDEREDVVLAKLSEQEGRAALFRLGRSETGIFVFFLMWLIAFPLATIALSTQKLGVQGLMEYIKQNLGGIGLVCFLWAVLVWVFAFFIKRAHGFLSLSCDALSLSFHGKSYHWTLSQLKSISISRVNPSGNMQMPNHGLLTKTVVNVVAREAVKATGDAWWLSISPEEGKEVQIPGGAFFRYEDAWVLFSGLQERDLSALTLAHLFACEPLGPCLVDSDQKPASFSWRRVFSWSENRLMRLSIFGLVVVGGFFYALSFLAGD